jgi:DNA repair protein RadA/Sms
MAKTKTIFVCQNCGAQRPRWEGHCRDCGAWNSFAEETSVAPAAQARGWTKGTSTVVEAVALSAESTAQISDTTRASSGIGELDRVLGGGLVRGSYILVGGDPGIGKSTLLLQMAHGLARQGRRVLYISAEESVEQTQLRARRLKAINDKILVASESRLDVIMELAKKTQPDALVIDSIQTVYMSDLSSAPGTVSQVRECAAELLNFAKGPSGTTVFLVGHVTKDGSLAGPRVLEHMVDTVLSFEGDPHYHYRLLRALKNRFGATNELAVFQMVSEGLKEVTNPSQVFLEERGDAAVGSSVFAAMEGSRPLLCEIQALTVSSPLAMPRRTAIGLDVNRVHLLMAVLEKYLNLDFSHKDVFVNVVGGLKISEPAMDLALAAALLSSYWNRPLPTASCFFGEIGLTGEVRTVAFAEERTKEARKLGFKNYFVPASAKISDAKLIRTVNNLRSELQPKTKPETTASI